jgi:hypothetical protein
MWSGPQNKRMKLTKLSAAPGWLSTTVWMEVPPRARAGSMDAGTASQLIRGVRRTHGGTLPTSAGSKDRTDDAIRADVARVRQVRPMAVPVPTGRGRRRRGAVGASQDRNCTDAGKEGASHQGRSGLCGMARSTGVARFKTEANDGRTEPTERRPPNRRMKLTKLSAAPGWLLTTVRTEVPPRAPAGRTDGGTASQLIRGVLRT